MTDGPIDGQKLEIGHFSSLTALSPYGLYSIHVNDMSGQSGHLDQTRPDCFSLKLINVFVFVAHLRTAFQSCFNKIVPM